MIAGKSGIPKQSAFIVVDRGPACMRRRVRCCLAPAALTSGGATLRPARALASQQALTALLPRCGYAGFPAIHEAFCQLLAGLSGDFSIRWRHLLHGHINSGRELPEQKKSGGQGGVNPLPASAHHRRPSPLRCAKVITARQVSHSAVATYAQFLLYSFIIKISSGYQNFIGL